MKPSIVGLWVSVLMLSGIALQPLGSALAADVKARPSIVQRDVLPFPRSERAQSVWASGACWSECGSFCAWGLVGCLSRDAQGQCLKRTDVCDRYCQRSCRTSGGPLLPIDF